MSYAKRGLNPLAYPALSRQISPAELFTPPGEGPVRLPFSPSPLPTSLLQPSPEVVNKQYGSETVVDILNNILKELRASSRTDEGWGGPLDAYRYYVRQRSVVASMSTVQLCTFDPTRLSLLIVMYGGGEIGTDPIKPTALTSTLATAILLNRHDHYGLCTSAWYAYSNAGGVGINECLDRSSYILPE